MGNEVFRLSLSVEEVFIGEVDAGSLGEKFEFWQNLKCWRSFNVDMSFNVEC